MSSTETQDKKKETETTAPQQKTIEAEAGKIVELIKANQSLALSGEQFNTWQSNVAKQNELFQRMVEAFNAKVNAAGVPSSPAAATGSGAGGVGNAERVKRISEKLGKTSRIESGEWIISKAAFMEEWRKAYKTAKEAVTTTNVPGIVFSKDVLLLPDQQTMVNIRPFVNFEAVPDGADTFHWHTLGKVSFAATSDSSTQSASSQTATRIAGTVARRGAYQVVGFEQGRALPFSLINAVEGTMMAAAVHDEAAYALQQPATSGSYVNWIKGSDGSTITSDDASGITLKYQAISKAIKLLTKEGYARESIVAFLHPTSYGELIDDAVVTLGLNPISSQMLASGQIDNYLGIKVVPTTAVYTQDNTTNDAYRNIVCVSNVALGLAARDQVEIETFRDIKNVETQISGGHYIDAKVISEKAYVRISTTAS